MRAFPACVVDVGSASGSNWIEAFGHLSYDDAAPPCRVETIFDLASLTKVIATTSIAMRAVADQQIRLDTSIAEVFPDCAWPSMRIRHLLDHSSGLPAHLRLWERAAGREAFRRAICATALERTPGSASVYSDPGFILLGLALETAAGQTLDASFERIRREIDGALMFRPPADLKPYIAPTERDPWRGRVLQGEVHDENAFALGAVAAHAGLFGTAAAVGTFARLVLRTFREVTALGSPDELRQFTTRSGVPGSSRALGWDTALPTSSCGTRMSPHAFGHTGFTGTSLWIDPTRDFYAVLLTNRVHPTRQNEKLLPLRSRFHDALPF